MGATISSLGFLDVAATCAMKGDVMRALILPALVLSVLAGCADPPAPAAPTANKAEAKPTAERYAELGSDDCEKWADHFSARLREATKRKIDECDQKLKSVGAGPSAADAADLEATNKEADRLHALIMEQCGQQVGAKYVRSDAACYMSAKKMEDWKSCNFESMFFSDYKAVAKNHEKLFDDRCKTELQKSASASNGNG
jgi:hypothetical protein